MGTIPFDENDKSRFAFFMSSDDMIIVDTSDFKILGRQDMKTFYYAMLWSQGGIVHPISWQIWTGSENGNLNVFTLRLH